MDRFNLAIFGILFLFVAGCNGLIPGEEGAAPGQYGPNEFCGDGEINLATEQCEVGIACESPDESCDVEQCLCVVKEEPTCSDNTVALLSGVYSWKEGMMCKDDCREMYGAEWTCDLESCVCNKGSGGVPGTPGGVPGTPGTPDGEPDGDVPEPLPCSYNSQITALGAAPAAPANACLDDCETLGPDYVCNLDACICKKKSQEFTCVENTKFVAADGKSTFKPGMACEDDCKKLGDSFTCDPDTCLCESTDEEEFYCAGNSVDVTGANSFDPQQHSCIDNCDDGYVCNMETCICESDTPGEVSCSSRRETFSAALPPFDPSTMTCLDDCPERAYCEPRKCVCEPIDVDYCADGGAAQITPDIGTIGPAEATVGTPGEEIPPDSFFDVFVGLTPGGGIQPPGGSGGGFPAESFFDVFVEINVSDNGSPGAAASPGPGVSSMDSFFDVFTEIEFPPTTPTVNMSTTACVDNCEVLGSEFECNPRSCVCEYRPKGEFSCFSNTENLELDPATGALANNYDPAYQCRDDWEKAARLFGGTWTCNPDSCVCEQEPVKCAGNTIDVATNNDNRYDWLLGQCEDNCRELGAGYLCDPFTCLCRKDTGERVYCSANTIDAHVRDSEGNEQTNEFDPSTDKCIDNCEQRFGSGSACDPVSCYCVPPDDQVVSCARYTEHMSVTGSTTVPGQCRDDCAKYYGSEYECIQSSCTCIKKEGPVELSCARGIQDPTASLDALYPDGWICKDDCPENQRCDLQSCYCVEPVETACGDGTVTTPEECDPGSEYTKHCPTGKECSADCKCVELPKHTECSDGQCKTVIGAGEDECGSDADCPYCGDGTVSPGEDCESDRDCDEGEECIRCECEEEEEPYCGDGTVDPGEDCESDRDCQQGEECVNCDCERAPYCGDGTVDRGEECESDKDCNQREECVKCQCEPLPYCGDGTVDPGEDCESDKQCGPGQQCINCQCTAFRLN